MKYRLLTRGGSTGGGAAGGAGGGDYNSNFFIRDWSIGKILFFRDSGGMLLKREQGQGLVLICILIIIRMGWMIT